jgi:hypothetical protein
MALKAKLIIASATVATTGAATGAVVGISTLATNSADSPIQFEPHTLNEALKVNDSTGTMDVTVAETFTESFVIPETHFLKDGQNVDNLFT